MKTKYLIAALAVICASAMAWLIFTCFPSKTNDEDYEDLNVVYAYDISDEEIENVEEKEDEPVYDLVIDEASAMYIAKTVYGDARGCSKIEQAAVIWTILNRVDSDNYPDTIVGVVTQHSQYHGYSRNHPVIASIYDLTVDVMTRWEREKRGETNVGRVLPKEYLYFYGDGKRNHFRDNWRGGNTWDWSLPNPYECEV